MKKLRRVSFLVILVVIILTVMPLQAFAAGWQQYGDEWYYFNTTDDVMLVNGWAKDSTGWMWMDSSGRITKDQWIMDSGE